MNKEKIKDQVKKTLEERKKEQTAKLAITFKGTSDIDMANALLDTFRVDNKLSDSDFSDILVDKLIDIYQIMPAKRTPEEKTKFKEVFEKYLKGKPL